MLIRDDRDFSEVLRLYQVEESEIREQRGHMSHRFSALLDQLANLAAALGRPSFRKGALFCFSQIAEVERSSPAKCGNGLR